MNARLTLVAHASTTATSTAAFAVDEPLEPRGAAAAHAARGSTGRTDLALRSPARACAETAVALGLDPVEITAAVADWDLGRWRGRTLDDVAATDPTGVTQWLSEPAAAPHGGESLVALRARVAGWLAALPADDRITVVTHPAVVRAVVLDVLSAPDAAFWRVDVAPLTATVLRGGPGRRTLRTVGMPLTG